MSSNSPPKFTAQDEEGERMTTTAAEILEAKSDLHGLTANFASLGRDKLVAIGLSEVDAELAKIPDHAKTAFLEAKRRCPELVDDERLGSFLCREGFDPKLTAQRIVKYWEYKYELFGPEKCFLPLTLRVMKDDMVALSCGLMQVLPVKDHSGRAILFVDPSRQDNSKYPRESMLRAIWYILHVACEDPDVRKLGLVILVYPRFASFLQIDYKIGAYVFDLEATCLPVRFRSVHLCSPGLLFHLVGPIMKFAMGKKLRLRLKVHHGNEADILLSLTFYGLARDRIPAELGGDIILDHGMWLTSRSTKEDDSYFKRNDEELHELPESDSDQSWEGALVSALFGQNGLPTAADDGAFQTAQTAVAVCTTEVSDLTSTNTPALQDTGASSQSEVEQERAARRRVIRQRVHSNVSSKGDTPVTDAPIHKITAQAASESSKIHDDQVKSLRAGTLASPTCESTTSQHTENMQNMAKLNRVVGATPQINPLPVSAMWADQRMNRAVVAKLENPQLSYLDALLIGGFSYSNANETGLPDKKIYDNENISLSQRKNQLARRLRNMKKARS